MRIFVVLSSVFAVGLCVGGFMKQDPSDQQFCDALMRLDSHVDTISFTNGCPQITSVYTQVLQGVLKGNTSLTNDFRVSAVVPACCKFLRKQNKIYGKKE